MVKNTSIDPDTGKRTTRNIESEETRHMNNGFGAFSIFGRNNEAGAQISNQRKSSQPSYYDRISNKFD